MALVTNVSKHTDADILASSSIQPSCFKTFFVQQASVFSRKQLMCGFYFILIKRPFCANEMIIAKALDLSQISAKTSLVNSHISSWTVWYTLSLFDVAWGTQYSIWFAYNVRHEKHYDQADGSRIFCMLHFAADGTYASSIRPRYKFLTCFHKPGDLNFAPWCYLIIKLEVLNGYDTLRNGNLLYAHLFTRIVIFPKLPCVDSWEKLPKALTETCLFCAKDVFLEITSGIMWTASSAATFFVWKTACLKSQLSPLPASNWMWSYSKKLVWPLG